MYRCIGATGRLVRKTVRDTSICLGLCLLFLGWLYRSGIVSGTVAIAGLAVLVTSLFSVMRPWRRNRAPSAGSIPKATSADLRQGESLVQNSDFPVGTHSLEVTADRVVWSWHDADHVTTHPRSLIVGVRLVANRVYLMRSETAWLGKVPFGAFETVEDMARFCEDLGGQVDPVTLPVAATTPA